ncbi:hypothetical protein ACLB2K_062578 [Fragaria x ananassa]
MLIEEHEAPDWIRPSWARLKRMMKHEPDLVSVVTRRCERFTAVMRNVYVVNPVSKSVGGRVHWISNLNLGTIMEWLHMARQTACTMHDDTTVMTFSGIRLAANLLGGSFPIRCTLQFRGPSST